LQGRTDILVLALCGLPRAPYIRAAAAFYCVPLPPSAAEAVYDIQSHARKSEFIFLAGFVIVVVDAVGLEGALSPLG